MKIVQINATCGIGSTGRICVSISQLLTSKGIENYILYSLRSSSYPLGIKFTCEPIRKMQALIEKVTGKYGSGAVLSTIGLIRKLKQIQPDVIHLHNIHNRDCNISMLFRYIRKNNIKVYWTFHDCWAFTGYCTHYDLLGCSKWKTECFRCPQYRNFSFWADRSKYNFNKKKKAYAKGVDMTIITPSRWLANQVYESFMNKYDIRVIHNGIDLSVFMPLKTNFRDIYRCHDKYIVLGISLSWDYKKGLDVFNYLAENLSDDYLIVMVGTVSDLQNVNSKILRIERTDHVNELVEIYSAANVFVNASREENYPTVNLEALACGTPIVAFDSGGTPETVAYGCGVVVPRNDMIGILNSVVEICENKIVCRENCQQESVKNDQNTCFEKYLELYEV